MTNEELVKAIRNGNHSLYAVLWDQTEKLIRLKAKKYYAIIGPGHGVDAEDLVQAGFFALVMAVQYYDEAKGYSFLAYLTEPLKTAFREAASIRTDKQARDPLHRAKDLKAPAFADGRETLEEITPDLNAEAVDDEAIRPIWLEQLRSELDRSLERIRQPDRDMIREAFFNGKARKVISAERGLSYNTVNFYISRGLSDLKRTCGRSLSEYIDFRTNFYRKGSRYSSAVEELVTWREDLRSRYERVRDEATEKQEEEDEEWATQ